MSVQDEIAKLEKETTEKQREADRLRQLQEMFPDIQRQVGRWNKVAYASKSVNTKVDKYELRHNCGCCPDSPLELWPYIETELGRIYSNPAKFTIGESNYRQGERSYPGWDAKLRAEGIPEAMIERVGYLFDDEETEEDEP